jgi:hypothetical protein
VEHGIDEAGLPRNHNRHTALSPRKVGEAAEALRALDVDALARQIDPRDPEGVREELRQWVDAVFAAEQRGRGILGHYG